MVCQCMPPTELGIVVVACGLTLWFLDEGLACRASRSYGAGDDGVSGENSDGSEGSAAIAAFPSLSHGAVPPSTFPGKCCTKCWCWGGGATDSAPNLGWTAWTTAVVLCFAVACGAFSSSSVSPSSASACPGGGGTGSVARWGEECMAISGYARCHRRDWESWGR